MEWERNYLDKLNKLPENPPGIDMAGLAKECLDEMDTEA
jgi:hypothetical protein